MSHWDVRAEALLASVRLSDPVPAGARDRVRASVAASIALWTAGVSAATPTAFAKLPAAVKAASSAISGSTVTVVPAGPIAFLAPVTVGLALGLSAISPSETVEPQPPVATVASARSSAAVKVPVRSVGRVVTGAAASMPGIEATKEPRSASLPIVSVVPKASAVPYSSLKEEASSLEHARVVLRQGDAELALRLLNQHREEFPRGVLSFEASATRAIVLCRLGQASEAFLILAQLEVAAPGSGVVAQARSACGAALPPEMGQ